MKKIDKRINEILESTKGSQRAQPKADLLAKIEGQIYGQEATIIPIGRLRLAVAAAVLLLFINGLAINTYFQKIAENLYTFLYRILKHSSFWCYYKNTHCF